LSGESNSKDSFRILAYKLLSKRPLLSGLFHFGLPMLAFRMEFPDNFFITLPESKKDLFAIDLKGCLE